jgi:hypothetical protein
LTSQSQIKLGLNFQPEISFANWEHFWYTQSFGVTSNFSVYKWLSINTGVGYQSKQFNVSVLAYQLDQIPMDLYLIRTISINIKLKANFLSSNHQIQFYGISGVILNFCVYQKLYYKDDLEPTKIIETASFYNALIGVGVGVEYNINRFSIFLEPSFNTTITRNCKYYHPYENTLSLNIGVLYKIKK